MTPGRRLARAAASNLHPMETAMNRILEVTDEDETLVLEFVNLDDLKNERILPKSLLTELDQSFAT